MRFSEEQWDTAYTWLCKQRLNYPANADIWHLSFNWYKEKSTLKNKLLSGGYHFSPLQSITKQDGSTIHLWSSRDALVLKLITLSLTNILPVSTRCTHVKAHGGLKATINHVFEMTADYQYVIRTDVKAYYASIDHHLLIEKLAIYIKDKALLNLLWHYLNRLVERGGLFKEITKGISRGCPLSPLIGAFFLSK